MHVIIHSNTGNTLKQLGFICSAYSINQLVSLQPLYSTSCWGRYCERLDNRAAASPLRPATYIGPIR